MTGPLSLRARLTAIILIPLVAIAAVIGAWAARDAQARADDRFNRALLTAALAVSRDVAVSGGDALSPQTNELLRDSFGGEVFYHVYAPDGAFVTGYATPPVPVTETFEDRQGQQYFEGTHQTRAVRAIRFVDAMQIDGLGGNFTITIWQDRDHRDALVRELVRGTFFGISLLVLAVAVVVWFGVRIGLRPLNDLEDAIARRSSDELTPIRRDVPLEVTGIVTTLNRLFENVAQSMTDQLEFISNAAHQLRNPIAGILSLAEAVSRAPSAEESRRRAQDLLQAAENAADLSQKLLLFERAKALIPAGMHKDFDLSKALEAVLAGVEVPKSLKLTSEIAPGLRLKGDEVMIREAVANLIDNAMRHGGAALSAIEVSCALAGGDTLVTVADNGTGIPAGSMAAARKRFEQLGRSSGSGLGLSIVEAVARAHGGTLVLSGNGPGLRAEMRLSSR
ncbi:MAG: sensor histidine kinase [Pseudomonadota bacterium]